MRIMITGGGTGGHVFPAVSVIEELGRRDPNLTVQWIGKTKSMEERVAARLGIPFRPISVIGWPRQRGLGQLWALLVLMRGIAQALFYLWSFRPDAVFSVGGYVCLPLALTAEYLGIKVFIHEQNQRLGMANRILSKRAYRILLSFPDTLEKRLAEKSVLTGNPIRSTFLHAPSQAEAKEMFELDPDLPVVLVVGGSQGSTRINQAVADVLRKMMPGEAQFLWMTGTKDASMARACAETVGMPVRVYSFLEEMAAACVAADVIIARSGASFAAELAVIGKPSILIPYPYATEGHQEQNALAFVKVGAALLLRDEECTGDSLLRLLRELLPDKSRRDSMARAAASLAKPNAAEKIVDEILRGVFELKNSNG